MMTADFATFSVSNLVVSGAALRDEQFLTCGNNVNKTSTSTRHQLARWLLYGVQLRGSVYFPAQLYWTFTLLMESNFCLQSKLYLHRLNDFHLTFDDGQA